MPTSPDDPLSREFRRKLALLPGVVVVTSKTRSGERVQVTVTARQPDGVAAVCRIASYANCVLHVYEHGEHQFFYVVVADARAVKIVTETPDPDLLTKARSY